MPTGPEEPNGVPPPAAGAGYVLIQLCSDFVEQIARINYILLSTDGRCSRDPF